MNTKHLISIARLTLTAGLAMVAVNSHAAEPSRADKRTAKSAVSALQSATTINDISVGNIPQNVVLLDNGRVNAADVPPVKPTGTDQESVADLNEKPDATPEETPVAITTPEAPRTDKPVVDPVKPDPAQSVI